MRAWKQDLSSTIHELFHHSQINVSPVSQPMEYAGEEEGMDIKCFIVQPHRQRGLENKIQCDKCVFDQRARICHGWAQPWAVDLSDVSSGSRGSV